MNIDSTLALRLENISKSYRIYNKPHHRLKQMVLRGRRRYFDEFWALGGVSFSVAKAECVGLIGRNGSGKSTLLQIVSGVLSQTAGELSVNGRVSALLELGTGFNPEFTGRENVFLNASILGFSRKEINRRFTQIADFADIGDFIDQPVKTYSSGMFVRLAFAVAINVDPEILVIDEALAVGDIKFQAKCFRKFEEFKKEGKTILFVTHSIDQIVRHCDRAILLEGGKIFAEGDPNFVANTYLNLLFGSDRNSSEDAKDLAQQSASLPSKPIVVDSQTDGGNGDLKYFLSDQSAVDRVNMRPGYNKAEYRWGDGRATIIDCLFVSGQNYNQNHFRAEDELSVYLKVLFRREIDRPIYGFTLKTPDGVVIFSTNSRDWNGQRAYSSEVAGNIVIIKFSCFPRLVAGHYLLSLGVAADEAEQLVALDRRYDLFEIVIINRSLVYGLADLEAVVEKINASSP